MQDLAEALFGSRRLEDSQDDPAATKTVTATALAASDGGTVAVAIGGFGGTSSIEVPTTVDVREGDTVQVTLTGDTVQTPVVTGVVGGGDRMRDNVEDAQATANATATLIRQYSDGVLVCKTGKSVGALVSANGSFDVVTVTWDGLTPTAGTAIASFDGDSIDLGGQTSAVNMCGGAGMVILDKTSNQIAIGGKNGAYLQDIAGIKSGSDQGIGYSYSNGNGKAVIVATEVDIHGRVIYSGPSITINGKKSNSATVARNLVEVGRTMLYDYGDSRGVWYEVHGGYVWVRCAYVDGIGSNGWKVPKLLPNAYRPEYKCYYPGAISGSNNVGAMWVGSNGEVWLYDYGNTGKDVCATAVYPLKK